MWWGGDTRHKQTLAAISAYEKLHPNVKITGEYGGYSGYEQKLITQLSGGTAPDIMQVDSYWIYELAAQGDMFVDLSKQAEIDTSAFNANVLKTYTIDGKLLGLPTGLNSFCMEYNKNLFKTMEIPENTDWTWDKILSIGSTVNKKDSSKYFLCQDSNESRLMLKAYLEQKTGNELIKSDGTLGFDKADLVDALTYYKKLVDNKVIQPPKESAPFENNPTQNPKWVNGDFGSIVEYTAAYTVNQANVKWPLGITKMPTVENAKGKVDSVPSMFIALNKNGKNVSEAAKFVNWFFTDSSATAILGDVRGVPPVQTARESLISAGKLDSNVNSIVNRAMDNTNVFETAYTDNSEFTKIMLDEIQKVGYNGADPTTIADEMINNFQQKIKEIKSAK
jgi:oligogalacturonide transport system substrate-binding protein